MARRFASLLLALALLLAAGPAAAETMIRIAVVEGASSLIVRAPGLRMRALTDDGFYEPVPGDAVRLERRGGGVALGGAAPVDAVKLRADGPITVGEKTVRGAVEVVADEGGLLAVNELPMESYLAAVLGSEMPPSFEPEALKAQAVAARTYAIGKKIAAEGAAYHLGSTVLAQVYGGVHREDPRTKAAVAATEGEVLVFDHMPIEAYFFSSCGGRTEGGAEALGRPLPYLTVHACPERADTPGARWSLTLSATDLGRRLGLGPVLDLSVETRTASDRARTVEVRTAKGRRRFTAVQLRQRIGYGALKSLAFEVDERGGRFHFHGRGAGHAAGLCQWGAQAAAQDGSAYREILGRYYPGVEIRRMY
ncbi:SpoIID/LytB domain-containing protein [Vulgatibacter sp.]|uniref:SpoIID/LytB domain-containing protein n=1 Tax=Vulgatibacter sp. TaxID=1971226 RepID=UPI0035645E1D